MALQIGKESGRDNIVHLNAFGPDDEAGENNWPASTALLVACVTGAVIWSLVIFAGVRLF